MPISCVLSLSIPRAENIRALATLLRVPLDWLYGVGSDRKVREPKAGWQASAVDSHAVDPRGARTSSPFRGVGGARSEYAYSVAAPPDTEPSYA